MMKGMAVARRRKRAWGWQRGQEGAGTGELGEGEVIYFVDTSKPPNRNLPASADTHVYRNDSFNVTVAAQRRTPMSAPLACRQRPSSEIPDAITLARNKGRRLPCYFNICISIKCHYPHYRPTTTRILISFTLIIKTQKMGSPFNFSLW